MKLDYVYSQIDELSKFVKFNRKKIAVLIKDSLNEFSNQYNNLTKENNNLKNNITNQQNELRKKDDEISLLTNKFNDLKKENENLTQKLNTSLKTIMSLNKKYNLVSSFLSAKPIKNDAMEEFNKLLYNDFIEFANNESSLKEEAKAILMMQDIEKKLKNIVTFPAIYNKTVVAVGGGFSAGKSQFLNNFINEKTIKLPVGINPVTAIPTYIIAGEKNIINGYSYKGGVVNIAPKLYKELSHDFIKSLGFNLRDIAPIITIETPMKSYENICFIDTPGYNPSYTENTDTDKETSKEFLKQANVLIWVIGIDTNGTIPASDLEFLENILLEDKKLYIVANKADLRSIDDIEDILDIFEEILDEYDIEYKGMSAFSSINREELSSRKLSLFEFLEDINNPIKVKVKILEDLKNVFDMYKNAIHKQIDWIKKIHLNFKSLQLDYFEAGMDLDNFKIINERIENIKKEFDLNHLQNQLNELNTLEEKFINSINEVFRSIQNQ